MRSQRVHFVAAIVVFVALTIVASCWLPRLRTREQSENLQSQELRALQSSDHATLDVPTGIPLANFSVPRDRLIFLLQRAAVWSTIKSDVTIDEHVVRLLPWVEDPRAVDMIIAARRRLTDGLEYQKINRTVPILVDSPFGATYLTKMRIYDGGGVMQSGPGLGHVDAVLTALAETGCTLDFELRTATRRFHLAEVLEDSLQRYSPARELEWSLVAYCAFLGRQSEWTNCHHTQMTMSDLVDRLIAQPLGSGPCNGTHQLWALAIARRKSESTPTFFSRKSAASIERWLDRTREICARNQSADGWWDRSWHTMRDEPSQEQYGTLLECRIDRLRTTGHLLEAFAVVQPVARLDTDSLERGLQWLLDELQAEPDLYFAKAFNETTHAIRAIMLYSGTLEYNLTR